MSTGKTYDAYIQASLGDFIKELKLEGPKAPHISFESLNSQFLALKAPFEASYAYAKNVTPPGLFTHCIRVTIFALALLRNGYPSDTPGVEQISEEDLLKRIWLMCMMHDVSLTTDPEALSHPAHAMSFELLGGFLALDHLNAAYPGISAEEAGDVAQGIMLHTIAWERGKSSAAAALLQMASLFDVLGFNAVGPGVLEVLWSRETVREVEAVYPRGSFGQEVVEMIVEGEMKKKPNCINSHGQMPLGNAAKITALADS